MAATQEKTYEDIINLRLKIQEQAKRGDDITSLEEELKALNEAFDKQLTTLNESKQVLKG